MKYSKPVLMREDPRKPTPPGERLKTEYMLDVAPDGTKRLVPTEEIDLQEMIQSHKSECSIKDIIARHEMLGTLDQLSVGQGQFFDQIHAPKNLMELEAVLRSARDQYKAMNADVKKDYPTFEAFLENFGSIQALGAFIDRYKKVEQDKEVADDGKADT